jgi:hypothetical protein
MNQSKENKSSARVIGLLKLCIAAGALFFIWYKVFHKENIRDVIQRFGVIFGDTDKKLLLVVILLLMFVNWLLEAVKWRMLVSSLQYASLFRSLEAVFAGLTVSFFTPNRVGEYAGRVMYLPPGSRIRGTLLTVIENLAQLSVTLITGAVSLPVFLSSYATSPLYICLPLSILSIFFSVFIVFCILRISYLHRDLSRLSMFRRYEHFIQVADYATPARMTQILFLSFLRFFVFSGQLFLLLKVFDVQVAYGPAMLMISLTFFVMTVIPTFAFTDLGVRGAAGSFFFGYLTTQLPGVVYATLGLWLVNLAIPAAAGAILLAISSPQRKAHE